MSTASLLAEPPQAAPALSLELTRVIAAPKQKVFDAWTRPEIIRQWFCPQRQLRPEVEVDAVQGGAYTFDMAAEGSQPGTAVTGRYTIVSPYDLLQFTWTAGWAPGEESLVTIRLRDVDGGTELRLVHERFATEQSLEAHRKGWNGGLDMLVETIQKLM